jgi:hypothetical protein
MTFSLSIIMDMILLCALGITIVYAVRLSHSLNAFKSQRNEFKSLFAELTKHIDKAYSALDALKNTGAQSGAELQEAISEARYMLDELQIVNAASESLAKRLERASGAQQSEDLPAAPESAPPKRAAKTAASPAKKASSWKDTLKPPLQRDDEDDDGVIFSIRDRDHEADSVTNIASHRAAGSENFASEAEKDLHNALSKKKK